MKSRNQIPKARYWLRLLSALVVSFLINVALSTAALAGNADWVNIPGLAALNGQVSGAATDAAGNLYVGGTFTMAGTNVVSNIAKWDGTNWSALGSGLNGGVGPMAVSGTNLYVCGQYSTAGSVPVNYIAQWNGSSWSPLGLGVTSDDPWVVALAVSGTNLYVGGTFTTAGTNESRYIAVANLTPQFPPLEPGDLIISRLPDGNVQVSYLPPLYSDVTIGASTDLRNWTVLTNITQEGVGMVSFEDTQATNYPQRFYGEILPLP
jgi:hypothetical protein